MEVLGISANSLAKALHVPGNRITAILHGQRGVTADTALRLARYLGTTPQVWLNLQKTWELRRAEMEVGPPDRGPRDAPKGYRLVLQVVDYSEPPAVRPAGW